MRTNSTRNLPPREEMDLCFPSAIFLMLLLFPSLQFHKSAFAHDEKYEECKMPFQCGNIILSYPFYDGVNRPSYCGYPGFQIDCRNNSMPQISMSSEIYYILSMETASNTITLAMQSYWDDLCPITLLNTTINSNLYKNTSIDDNITLVYNCPKTSLRTENEISCITASTYNRSYSPVGYIVTQNMELSQVNSLYKSCPNRILVTVAVAHSLHGSISDTATLQNALHSGFGLEWIAEKALCDGCRISGGECGYDTILTKFNCYCPNQPYDFKCSTGGNGSTSHKVARKAGIIILACIIGLGIVVLLACFVKRKWPTDNPEIEAFLKKCGFLAPERYSYSLVKKITNSFDDSQKLGEGGYGTVYKGKLPDDRLVAVKLLKENRGNANDFINEFRSSASTNHVNIVKLLGFCFEGEKKALIYDFMPNGSLDKFIGRNNYQSLAWDKLFQIAVGIAKGLEYLHKGCNTKIVHFDIKPRNILLDENLCPKIADFGLAKLCQQNVSNVPMSQARGTLGFVAPEVRNGRFDLVSHKSDVYGYGMLVLDMYNCRNNVNAQAQLSTQYFPHWIYKQLEQTGEIGHQDILLNEEENGTLRRKVILVGLWCIQENPSARPQMSRVVEMLEGPLASLQIPPRPSSSPSQISQPEFSTESITSEYTNITQVPLFRPMAG